jgi:hypothetical protein
MFDYASFRFWPVSEEQLQDGKVRNCCIVALRWSSGKGKLWPTVADQEPRFSGVFCVWERQVLAESTHSATKIGLDDPNAYFRPNYDLQRNYLYVLIVL